MKILKITFVYNNEGNPGFMTGWGFSCLVEYSGSKILFDTGCDGPELIFNMKKLGLDPKEIDTVVLSHQHLDHIGGLFTLLCLNKTLRVFVLSSFSSKIKEHIKKNAECIEIKEGQEICKNIFTTGLIKGNPDEQSLLVKTKKGIVVLTGCSHPGVDRILGIAEHYGKVFAIIGGLHGFNDFNILKNIPLIGACHCTQYKQEIKEKFPNSFREIRAGDIIQC